MKKAALAGALLAFCAGPSSAGEAHHYDFYYNLPVKAGSKGLDVGLNSADINRLGDMGDVAVMHKYSISVDLEAGARATFGFLNEARDSFSSIVAGAKYGLNEKSAATLNLLAPAGDVDELGLSAGYMITVDLRGLKINNHIQVGYWMATLRTGPISSFWSSWSSLPNPWAITCSAMWISSLPPMSMSSAISWVST